jgi:hypothetical protein
MNNSVALNKHDIYTKLTGLNDRDLHAIAEYVDFLRHKNKLGKEKILRLQGILKDQQINFSSLKKFRQETWNHVDKEASGE